MSAPRSPTETKVVPSGGRPIVSTVSAQTADSRVWGVTPLGGRAQIVWWARPSVAPEGSTARQLWAKNPVPRSSPTRPAPLSVRCGEKSRIVSSWTMRTIECRAAAARHCATCGSMTASRVTAPQSNSRYPALVLASEPSCRGKLSSGARADRRHDAHETVGASRIPKVSRPELGLGPMTRFIEHVRSLARPPEAAKSARDMRSLAYKRKMWVTVSTRGRPARYVLDDPLPE